MPTFAPVRAPGSARGSRQDARRVAHDDEAVTAMERTHPAASPSRDLRWVVVLDLAAKALLLIIVTRVAMDPGWGNLEGKAPGTRVMTYPMLALVLPAAHLLVRPFRCYPWGADLLLTVPCFSDVLGNRLDLYDEVAWFDDVIHFVNTGLLSAAVVVLSGVAAASPRRRLEVAVAAGMTASLAWEVWEYFAFVARSGEVGTAYGDTVGDLALGWMGAVVAGLLVGVVGPRGRADPDGPSRASVGRSAHAVPAVDPAPTATGRTYPEVGPSL